MKISHVNKAPIRSQPAVNFAEYPGLLIVNRDVGNYLIVTGDGGYTCLKTGLSGRLEKLTADYIAYPDAEIVLGVPGDPLGGR